MMAGDDIIIIIIALLQSVKRETAWGCNSSCVATWHVANQEGCMKLFLIGYITTHIPKGAKGIGLFE